MTVLHYGVPRADASPLPARPVFPHFPTCLLRPDLWLWLVRQQPKLLGTTENALGLKEFCEKKGWDLVITADKEGAGSVFAKEIETAE